jgi:hypothetical protein
VNYREIDLFPFGYSPIIPGKVRRANPDFSVPVYSSLINHIKRLAEGYRQLPECQEKSYCSLMVDGANKLGRRLLAVTMFMEGHVRFAHLKLLNDKRALTIASSLVQQPPIGVKRE